MTPLTRKQREIAAREELILDVARGMLLERGYIGLTMDRVAQATEYSKGTIYHHFSSKEDLVVALAAQTAQKRTTMFQRAATFNGGSRERLTAIGMASDLFVNLYPDHFRSEQLVHAASVRAKCNPENEARLEMCEGQCFSTVAGVIRDGIAQGDLELREDTTVEDFTFTLWTMSFGNYFIRSTDSPLTQLGVDPQAALQSAFRALLDGYGWRPLSTEWDDAATTDRIAQEVFPDEFRRLRTR